jgi:predicted CoA-substrate-specific enzyme activase
VYLGLDIGSSSSKAVLLGENQESLAAQVVNLGTGTKGVGQVLEAVYRQAGIGPEEVRYTVVTGYGRMTYQGADRQITEISCHAKGVFHLSSSARTIVDVGGQDTKVIRLGQDGSVENFVMNDKCAAGTGRFLEMMARTLQMKLPEMSELGLDWHNDVTISSMCTVFAESEVVSLIARSTAPADIIHGLNKSVAGKTAALARRTGGVAPFMMTGGVARNRGVVKELETALKAPVEVSEYSQLCGSLGAALFALEKMGVKL